MESAAAKTDTVPDRGYRLVRIVVAVLLLTASFLKCWQLATEPIIGTGFLDSRWLLMATVEFELFFGLWLMANILPKPTWIVALACFGLFTCVSLYKALSGAASCGCFGRVQVNPWYTTTLDFAVVLSLLRWRPQGLPSLFRKAAGDEGMSVWTFITHHSSFSIPRLTAVLSLWLLLGLPAAYAMGSYVNSTLSEAGEVIGNGKIVVLEPERWIGKRFPLIDYIDIGDQLKEGKWLVLLYHHDCPKCIEALPKYRELAQCAAVDPMAARVAIIEIAPYGDNKGLLLSETNLVRGRLTDNVEWLVETPVQLLLRSAKVNPAVMNSEISRQMALYGEAK